MDRPRDPTTCCLLLPDWLDYAFSVLTLRVGGYRALEEESPANRILNIRYHEADRDWVDEYLRPAVQGSPHFFSAVSFGDKLLRQDDAFVFDRFKDDVEVSFKTVFVISRSSLADANFLAMIRASLQHVNRVRLKKVLLVFLEQASEMDLPYGVAIYVDRELPYLEWPQGAGKRVYFWKKFTKLITINQGMTTSLPERCYLESPWHR